MEDGDGGVHLRNLSVNAVTSEEEALNALFLGDTNRMIAETPMNLASTRSHCIFTVYVTSRPVGSPVFRKSKVKGAVSKCCVLCAPRACMQRYLSRYYVS